MALVHTGDSFIAMVIEAALISQSHDKAWNFIISVLNWPHPLEKFQDVEDIADKAKINVEKLKEAFQGDKVQQLLQCHVTFSRRVLNLNPGDTALLSNGRVR